LETWEYGQHLREFIALGLDVAVESQHLGILLDGWWSGQDAGKQAGEGDGNGELHLAAGDWLAGIVDSSAGFEELADNACNSLGEWPIYTPWAM